MLLVKVSCYVIISLTFSYVWALPLVETGHFMLPTFLDLSQSTHTQKKRIKKKKREWDKDLFIGPQFGSDQDHLF